MPLCALRSLNLNIIIEIMNKQKKLSLSVLSFIFAVYFTTYNNF